MRKPFNNDFPITQTFGNKLIINGVDIYGQWGYKGHNGIDYGTPSGTPIVAPHSGRVIESAYDSSGYGNYVKIENDIEGSVLAHFSKTLVSVGQEVKEGQQIALSGNTGNSTGPHLHWGYYRHPRNRQNGYGGFIDQTPYLIVTPEPMNEYQEKLNKWFNFETTPDQVITFLNERKREIKVKDQRIGELEKVVSSQSTQLLNLRKENEALSKKLEESIKLVEQKEALRAKWYSLYETSKDNFETCKQGNATLQKKLTECQNKQDFTVGELVVRLWNKVRGVKI